MNEVLGWLRPVRSDLCRFVKAPQLVAGGLFRGLWGGCGGVDVVGLLRAFRGVSSGGCVWCGDWGACGSAARLGRCWTGCAVVVFGRWVGVRVVRS